MADPGGRQVPDSDGKFCLAWQHALASGGVETVALPPLSPNLNAVAERWVRIAKSECLRRCWCIRRGGLERALNRYLVHYHEQRPHQGNRPRKKSAPAQRSPQISIADFSADKVRWANSNNGTLRHYYLAA